MRTRTPARAGSRPLARGWPIRAVRMRSVATRLIAEPPKTSVRIWGGASDETRYFCTTLQQTGASSDVVVLAKNSHSEVQ